MTTPYGKEIKMRLVQLDQTQEWLISEVRSRTGLFFDNGYLYKILTGQRNAPKITAVINEVLELDSNF